MTLKDAKNFTQWIARWAFAGLVAGWLISQLPIGRDDTDPGAWGARSGMIPATDSATGCQYLRAPGGGITPRLTESGQHMGCRK